MHRFVKAVIIASALLSAVSCKKNEFSFQDFMDEVNVKHKNVVQFDGDYGKYMPLKSDKSSYISKYLYNPQNKFSGDAVLTQTDIEEDMTILFDILQTDYSLYQYFGGNLTFDKAKNNILEECKSMGEDITAQVLETILIRNLYFVKDGHFAINHKRDGISVPFFFRDIEFFKTGSDYTTREGNKVLSVNGYDNLDELFKPSISKTGEIVYYPIVLEEREFFSSIFNEQICTKELTIKLSDGSAKVLTAEPYQIYVEENDQNITFLEKENIPVIVTRGFDYNNGGNKLASSGKDYNDKPIVIFDLSLNPGGDGKIAFDWLSQYTGESIPSNSLIYNMVYKKIINKEPDQFISHDSLLIVLTGKYSASSSELMIDKLHNLENTVFIGENTMGTMIGVDLRRIQLPNSRISFTVPSSFALVPEDTDSYYFEELRGFYPDLWVPAAEAQDAAIRLVNYYK